MYPNVAFAQSKFTRPGLQKISREPVSFLGAWLVLMNLRNAFGMPSECLQNVDCLRLLCLTSLPIIFPTVCRLQLTRDHLDFPLSWAVDLVKNVAR